MHVTVNLVAVNTALAVLYAVFAVYVGSRMAFAFRPMLKSPYAAVKQIYACFRRTLLYIIDFNFGIFAVSVKTQLNISVSPFDSFADITVHTAVYMTASRTVRVKIYVQTVEIIYPVEHGL